MSRLLEWSPLVRVVDGLTRDRLRVLTYHHVPDPALLAEHLDVVLSRYRPVGAEDVLAATRGRPLPKRAVWVTFDDGHPDAISCAGLLASRGVRASALVCPGVVDTDRPFWQEELDAALADDAVRAELAGSAPRGSFREQVLRAAPARRAEVLERARGLLARAGSVPTSRQVTSQDLQLWCAAGHHVGNHTWDHPPLDTLDARAAREEIGSAQDWLDEWLPRQVRVFAHPFGRESATSRSAAREVGFDLHLRFDHRLARVGPGHDEVSRLRTDIGDSSARLRSTLSGIRGVAYATRRWRHPSRR